MKSVIILCWVVLISSAESAYCPRKCVCREIGKLSYVGCVDIGLISIDVSIPPSAQWLALSNNSIFALYSYEFKVRSLVKVEVLELDGNEINYIGSSAFDRMHRLTYLNLRSNRITDLDPDTFNNTESLVKLDLSFNPLNILSDPFLKAPSIQELSLRGCNLNYIPPGAFRSMSSLMQLDLSNNHITTINTLAFTRLPNLSRIVAYRNELKCDTVDDLIHQLLMNNIDISGIDCGDLKFNLTTNVESSIHHNSSVNIIPNQVEIKNGTVTFIKIHKKLVVTNKIGEPEFDYKDDGENLDPNRDPPLAPPAKSRDNSSSMILNISSGSEKSGQFEMMMVIATAVLVLTSLVLLCTCITLCRCCMDCRRRHNDAARLRKQWMFKGPVAPNSLEINQDEPPPKYYQMFQLTTW